MSDLPSYVITDVTHLREGFCLDSRLFFPHKGEQLRNVSYKY